MSRKFWKRWLWTGALAAAAAPAMVSMSQGEEPPPTTAGPVSPQRVLVTQPGAGGQPLVRYLTLAADAVQDAAAEALPTSEFWIGVGLDAELPPLAKEQLGIKHGLAVIDPFPDSPATKAGIKQHDILTMANGKALTSPADLIRAVDEAKETELEIVLLRGGKEMTVKVTPTKRPQPNAETTATTPAAPNSPELKAEIDRLEAVLQSLKGKTGANGPLALSFVYPPIVARSDVFKPAEFPKDLRVQITKEGEEPAKIHVKRGDKEWEVTEDKLGDLPDDVRMHVEMFRGRPHMMRYPMAIPPQAGAAPHAIRVTPEGKIEGEIRVTPPELQARHFREVLRHPQGPQNVDAKLDAILKKLDHMENKAIEELQHEVKELRKELDEIRGKSPGEQSEGASK